MVVWSIWLCISISSTDCVWSMTQKIKIWCEEPTGPECSVSWSRTATWPGSQADWSCLCHPGWRWHGWSRSTSPSAGVQGGGRATTWTEPMEVRDCGSTFDPLFICFICFRLSGNFSTIQPIGFRRSIDITLLPTKDLVYEGNMISVFNVYLSMYICLHIVQGNTRSLEAFLVPSLAEFGVGLWPFLFFSSNHI